MEEGIRIDPPPSVPNPNGVTPAAMDAAAPALEPPGVLAAFQGLRVIPVKGLSPTGLQPYSLVVVFPMMTAAAALSVSTAGASSGAMLPSLAREPDAYGRPPTAIRSFTETGSPWRRPSGVPCMTAVSARLAAARAPSASIAKKQFKSAWVDAALLSARSTRSTGEICFPTMSFRRDVALI